MEKGISSGALLPSDVSISLLKSGLQPHSYWVSNSALSFRLAVECMETASFIQHQDGLVLNRKQALMTTQHARWWQAGQSSSTAWEYFWLALHKVCALGVEGRGWEHDKLNPATPVWLGSLSFCPCLFQLIPSAAAPHQSSFSYDSWESEAQLPGTSSTLVILSTAYPCSPWLIAARTQLRPRIKSSCVSKAKVSQTSC